MTGGVVSRLHLRGPSGSFTTARARIEDALARTTTDERLLLLRHLDLGRLPPRAPALYWADRTDQKIAEAWRRAVHGSAPGAASADAVWFHSLGEAWTLLLRELAFGRAPMAWFWRLAVRDWRGARLEVWLPQVARAASRDPAIMVRLAHALAPVIEAGIWGLTLAALAAAPAPAPAKSTSTRPSEAEQAAAWRIVSRLDRRVRDGAAAAIRAAPQPGVQRDWIARLLVLPAAPELAFSQAALAAVAHAFMGYLTASQNDTNLDHSEAMPPPEAPRPMPPPASEQTARRPMEVRPEWRGRPWEDHGATVPESTARPVNPRTSDRDGRGANDTGGPDIDWRALAARTEPIPVPAESFSPLAGLFLLIRPLILLDFPAWLARHPDRLLDGFARHLLPHIARRMRCSPDDPVLAAVAPPPLARPPLARPPLAADPPEPAAGAAGRLLARAAPFSSSTGSSRGPAPAPNRGFRPHLPRSWAAPGHRDEPGDDEFGTLSATIGTAADTDPALAAWRVGLDRWLRRVARISLSQTVRRPGWVLAEGERVSVRFRLDAADIRLRRRALDIDPGWVPFLGLVVRYDFRDEPLS